MNGVRNAEPWLNAIDSLQAPAESHLVRTEELKRFLGLGFPTRSAENWKYTRAAAFEAFTADWLKAGSPQKSNPREYDEALAAARAYAEDNIGVAFVLVDGAYVAEKTEAPLPDGVTISSTLLASESLVAEPATALRSLNAALASAVLNIDIADNNESRTDLCFIHVSTCGGPVLASPRIAISVGAHSTLRITEFFLDTGTTEIMTNAVCALKIGNGATVTHFRLQELGHGALHVAELSADIAAAGTLTSFALDTGGKLVRNDVNVRLTGPDASVSLHGIYLTKISQHIDNHILIDHLSPNTSSQQEYSGIADDQSRVVFNGKVRVHPGADGTDARQTNRNLLLSDTAEVDTKPELEIYADDVKCAHGATVGQLDEDALFYLMSRGLEPRLARELLIKAFVYSTTSEIDQPAIRRRFEDVIAGTLAAGRLA